MRERTVSKTASVAGRLKLVAFGMTTLTLWLEAANLDIYHHTRLLAYLAVASAALWIGLLLAHTLDLVKRKAWMLGLRRLVALMFAGWLGANLLMSLNNPLARGTSDGTAGRRQRWDLFR